MYIKYTAISCHGWNFVFEGFNGEDRCRFFGLQEKTRNVSKRIGLLLHKTFQAGEVIKRCYDCNAIFLSILREKSMLSSHVQWRSG